MFDRPDFLKSVLHPRALQELPFRDESSDFGLYTSGIGGSNGALDESSRDQHSDALRRQLEECDAAQGTQVMLSIEFGRRTNGSWMEGIGRVSGTIQEKGVRVRQSVSPYDTIPYSFGGLDPYVFPVGKQADLLVFICHFICPHANMIFLRGCRVFSVVVVVRGRDMWRKQTSLWLIIFADTV